MKSNNKEWKYVALSPDGFELQREPVYHNTIKEAEAEIMEWKKRYQGQGYYSGMNGRIEYDDIQYFCKAKKILM